MGKPLRSSGKATADGTMIYRSSVHDCAQCELKSRCCPNTPQRKITRQRHEAARDVARLGHVFPFLKSVCYGS